MDSPLCYVGGKSRLAKIISEEIPEHKTYCEVFAGAAWVFFRKEPSQIEVINDLDGDLITFYRVVQNHLEEFLRQFKWLITSREVFQDYTRQVDAGGLTDIQRAARYYYIQRLCFGGKVKGRTFGTAVDRPPRINLLRIEEEMSDIHIRLARVTIEHLDYKDLIEKYDRNETFFYLDPPYYKAPFYKHNFLKLEDYQTLSELLSKIHGKFILSLNDHPDIQKIFSSFNMAPVVVPYSVGQKKRAPGKELLITNYKAFTKRIK
jgi:DNA adenine methylase